MKAMVLEAIGKPLVLKEVPIPTPKEDEVLIRVAACGVCRTDLHLVEGDLPHPKLPLIPGHQIVGTIEKIGAKSQGFKIGDRVGVPWLAETCGTCTWCLEGKENLCDSATFTGYQRDGGFAEYCTAKAAYILPLPPHESPELLAPLLCAGLIGFRALRKAGNVHRIGFYGFGSSAHLLIQTAISLGKEIYVFTRPGDSEGQTFATSLGAVWAGGSDTLPPHPLEAALIFAPVGALYPQALKALAKGGKVISAGIHMSDIPAFPYRLLWEEREMTSVANLTREDGIDYMNCLKKHPVHAKVEIYPLEKANEALQAIKNGTLKGSAVLIN